MMTLGRGGGGGHGGGHGGGGHGHGHGFPRRGGGGWGPWWGGSTTLYVDNACANAVYAPVVGSDGLVYYNAVCVPPGVVVVGSALQGLGDTTSTSFLSTPVTSLFNIPLGWVLLAGVGTLGVIYAILR
jgi:hypothetical protein